MCTMKKMFCFLFINLFFVFLNGASSGKSIVKLGDYASDGLTRVVFKNLRALTGEDIVGVNQLVLVVDETGSRLQYGMLTSSSMEVFGFVREADGIRFVAEPRYKIDLDVDNELSLKVTRDLFVLLSSVKALC